MTTDTAPSVSIIVISYNTRQMTLECLRSIYLSEQDLSCEVIVVDNDSRDDSAQAIVEEFPGVRLFKSPANRGFAAANNFAAKHARGASVMLLNSDTIVKNGAIGRLVEFATENNIGICGGRTEFCDGTLNPTSCWDEPTVWSMICRATGLACFFPESRWFDRESIGWWKRDTHRVVDTVSGCFMLVTRQTWEALAGFDEEFHMYGEDMDFCRRARAQGCTPHFTPSASIVHYGGASDRILSERVVRQFVARAQYFRKHWNGPSRRIGVLCLDLWAMNKLLRAYLRGLFGVGNGSEREAWARIWTARAKWHLKSM